MTKRFHPGKGLWIWVCVSAVLIIAGIVLGCLFGFNYTADHKALEVTYDTSIVAGADDQETKLVELVEATLDKNGLSYEKTGRNDEMETNYVSENGNYMLRYVFDASVSDEVLDKVCESIETQSKTIGDDIGVSYHVYHSERFYEASWRGAVALAVAAIVALVYVGFRFGWDSALAGLVACVNDTCVSLAIIVLTRIPVAAYAPVLYVGIALVFSAILWLIQCMKMRENFKDPSYAALSPEEAVGSSVRKSLPLALGVIIPLVWVFVLFGVIATSGLRFFMIFALIPLAVSVYSSFLLAPAVYVPLKSKFDRIRSRRKRYFGKKKAEAQE